MKLWAVNIPLLVREQGEADDRDPREYTTSIRFDVKANSAQEAAHILWERLEPTCGDS